MTAKVKARIIRVTAHTLAVGTPLIATLSYFPLWRERGGEHVVSGIALMLVIVCALPLIREFKQIFKSPSAPLIWLLVFILFLSVSRIAEQVCVISLFGFISSLFATALYKISERVGRSEG